MSVDPTHSEEILRFEFLESDAERRYAVAIEHLDNDSAARAAQDWKRASEALDNLLGDQSYHDRQTIQTASHLVI